MLLVMVLVQPQKFRINLIYDSQGKYNETEPLYVRSLEIWERQPITIPSNQS